MKTLSRFIAIAVFCALVFAGTGFGQQQAVIAGWNIFGVDPIPDNRIERIAEAIRRINPHLIVLTEVNDDSVPGKIVQKLGSDYSAPIILEQGPEVVQNIALIFKNDVSVTSAKLIEGTDIAEEPRSRKALTAKVRIGKFDFVVIGVHLKSGRTNSNRKMRTRQAAKIAEFITTAVSGAEKDVLVIGDYNMIPPDGNNAFDQANFIAMSPANFLRFLSTDFLLGQTSHISGCNPFKGNLLDGFAISRQPTRREFVAGSTKLLSSSFFGKTCFSFKNQLSDHFPVVSRFKISLTDDD